MRHNVRLLVVTPYYKPAFRYGGPARSIPAMCEGLARLGVEVTVFTTDADGSRRLDVPTDRPVEADGVRVRYFRRSKRLPGRYFHAPDLGRACGDLRGFDVVYVCGNWTYPSLLGARSAAGQGIPYVSSPRGGFMTLSMRRSRLKKSLYLRLFERSCLQRAALLHCTTQMEAEQLRQWDFGPPIEVVPNGVDLARFENLPGRGALRGELGIPPQARVSLFVGRLHQAKRLDRTLEIFQAVAARDAQARLVVVGEDEDGSGREASALSRRLGLVDRVHFTGLLVGGRLAQAFADSDLLVLLSRRENFGMVVVEAMAAGLPALLTPEVGIAAEAESAGAAAVASADSAGIGPLWSSLLSSPSRRAAMSEAGRRLARENYSRDAVAGRTLAMLERAVRRGGSRSATPRRSSPR